MNTLFDYKLFTTVRAAAEYALEYYNDADLFTVDLHLMHGVGTRLSVYLK